MRLGAHCSVRRGFVPALDQARALGCDTLQIFPRAHKNWRSAKVGEPEAEAFQKRRRELGLQPLIIHTAFMPNLSTRDPAVYARSRRALVEDLDVCQTLGADYLVIHPGAYSVGADVHDGIQRMAHALNEALATTTGVSILIENVAGGGRRIGSTWEELAEMLEGVHAPDRVGICLDTAHTWGAGYGFSSVEEVNETLESLDRIVGLGRVAVIHANDSSADRGSHLDLHEHIGQGKLGRDCFKALLNHPGLQNAVGIIETPRESPEDDSKNLDILRSLFKRI
jgi:deoxyribonuclease IV